MDIHGEIVVAEFGEAWRKGNGQGLSGCDGAFETREFVGSECRVITVKVAGANGELVGSGCGSDIVQGEGEARLLWEFKDMAGDAAGEFELQRGFLEGDGSDADAGGQSLWAVAEAVGIGAAALESDFLGNFYLHGGPGGEVLGERGGEGDDGVREFAQRGVHEAHARAG